MNNIVMALRLAMMSIHGASRPSCLVGYAAPGESSRKVAALWESEDNPPGVRLVSRKNLGMECARATACLFRFHYQPAPDWKDRVCRFIRAYDSTDTPNCTLKVLLGGAPLVHYRPQWLYKDLTDRYSSCGVYSIPGLELSLLCCSIPLDVMLQPDLSGNSCMYVRVSEEGKGLSPEECLDIVRCQPAGSGHMVVNLDAANSSKTGTAVYRMLQRRSYYSSEQSMLEVNLNQTSSTYVEINRAIEENDDLSWSGLVESVRQRKHVPENAMALGDNLDEWEAAGAPAWELMEVVP